METRPITPPSKSFGKPKLWIIYDDGSFDDDEINTILNNPLSKRKDIIAFYSNNQLDSWNAKIIMIDGEKQLGLKNTNFMGGKRKSRKYRQSKRRRTRKCGGFKKRRKHRKSRQHQN